MPATPLRQMVVGLGLSAIEEHLMVFVLRVELGLTERFLVRRLGRRLRTQRLLLVAQLVDRRRASSLEALLLLLVLPTLLTRSPVVCLLRLLFFSALILLLYFL